MLLGRGELGASSWCWCPRDPTPDKRLKMDGLDRWMWQLFNYSHHEHLCWITQIHVCKRHSLNSSESSYEPYECLIHFHHKFIFTKELIALRHSHVISWQLVIQSDCSSKARIYFNSLVFSLITALFFLKHCCCVDLYANAIDNFTANNDSNPPSEFPLFIYLPSNNAFKWIIVIVLFTVSNSYPWAWSDFLRIENTN